MAVLPGVTDDQLRGEEEEDDGHEWCWVIEPSKEEERETYSIDSA